VSFANYKGNGKYIVITTNREYTAGITYIDDIKVDYINTCARPEEVELVSVGSDNAVIEWDLPANTTAKVVVAAERLDATKLNTAVVGESDVVAVQTVNDTMTTVVGLKDNTLYYVYVRNLCGDEMSSWSNYMSFRTNCVEKMVGEMGIEDMDDYKAGNGTQPLCYTVGNKSDATAASYIPQIASSKGASATKALKFYSTVEYNGAYAISPAIKVDSISRLRVKFTASAKAGDNYAQQLVVGVLTDIDDLSTFVPMDTLTNISASHRPYEVYFNTYEGDWYGEYGRRVMFISECDKLNEVYVDNIEFDTIPECFTNMTITNITDSKVSLRFTSDAMAYQVKYSTSLLDDAKLEAETENVVIINGKSGDITGLQYHTTYYIYARAICGDTYGEWASYQMAQTNCY
jgi:hypothetical protein